MFLLAVGQLLKTPTVFIAPVQVQMQIAVVGLPRWTVVSVPWLAKFSVFIFISSQLRVIPLVRYSVLHFTDSQNFASCLSVTASNRCGHTQLVVCYISTWTDKPLGNHKLSMSTPIASSHWTRETNTQQSCVVAQSTVTVNIVDFTSLWMSVSVERYHSAY